MSHNEGVDGEQWMSLGGGVDGRVDNGCLWVGGGAWGVGGGIGYNGGLVNEMEMRGMLDAVVDLVCTTAQRELLGRFRYVRGERKADGSVITAADTAMQSELVRALEQRWPEIVVLGEEMSAHAQEQALAAPGGQLWCIDPLDGTTNFAAGFPFFSVSLALIENGEPVLGVVYDPVRDECFTATRGGGAALNGAPVTASSGQVTLQGAVAVVDFKRLPNALAQRLVANPPYASQRNLGSVALEWAWLASGRSHLYLHGAQKIWDLAAGSLILAEAGGQSSTLQGHPTLVADVKPHSAVAAASPSLHSQWMDWLNGET